MAAECLRLAVRAEADRSSRLSGIVHFRDPAHSAVRLCVVAGAESLEVFGQRRRATGIAASWVRGRLNGLRDLEGDRRLLVPPGFVLPGCRADQVFDGGTQRSGVSS